MQKSTLQRTGIDTQCMVARPNNSTFAFCEEAISVFMRSKDYS